MRIFKKILLGFVIFIVLLGIAGFFIAPAVVKPIALEKISAALHRQVSIDKISINPFALSLTVRGFALEDPGGQKPFVAFDELYVNVDGLSSLYRRALILEDIILRNPYIVVTRKTESTYNFSDLLPKEEAKAKPEEKPFLFSLNNIQVINGKIDFQDKPNSTNHTVREMHFTVPFVSNIEYYLKNYVEPKFTAIINGDKFELTGKTQPFLTSHATSFDVDIQDLDIPYYLQYVPVKMNFKLPSAKLDTKMKINFIMSKDKSPSLTVTGNVILREVALDDLQNNKILRLPSVSVDMVSVEPLVPNIHLAKIAVDSPQLVIRRDKQGEINLLNLVKKQTAKEKHRQKTPAPAGSEKKPELKFRVDNFLIDKADITFIDSQPSQPVNLKLSPLRLAATNISLDKGAQGKIELVCSLDKKGEITAAGPLTLEPLSTDLQLDVKRISIRKFQSYFTDKVKIDVTSGAISTTGNISLVKDGENEPVIKYAGNLSVFNLAAVDKAQSNDFLKWKKLSFNQLKAGYNPFFLDIQTISLNDFYARIIINPDKTTNLQDILDDNGTKEKENKAVTAAPAENKPGEVKTPEKPADIKIGKVIFKDGNIDFSDRNIKPNYSANMLNLNGSITGLSSQNMSRAKVAVKGNLGYGAPIDIAGEINPLAKDLFADIKINFSDIELSPVTPYTNKFLGYPITKGKLNFNVSYLIDKKKLVSENKIRIDQLTFGDKVESPDAIKAPVTLAVSLLTDRNGQINLDIPVSGSLDDPQFKIWPIIWQVIGNLITKAVTAPFSLLASLIGGGEEMSFVEFDYGSAVVTDAGRKKINLIGKALFERPNIKVDIEGYIDPENDKAALKKAEFDHRINAQKLREMLAKGEKPVALEQIRITPQEYAKYLKQIYSAANFTKPRNALGMQKDQPPAEMEKLILANIEVTESDLRQLAARRAQNVKEAILQPGNVAASRIFIVAPKTPVPEKKEKVKDSRVDFKLK